MAALNLAACQQKQAVIRKPLLMRPDLCTLYILSVVPLRKPKPVQKNDGNMLPSCTKQPSGRHCHAVLGGLGLQLHPYHKISGRRNCAGPLLPANSRKSHSLSRWRLTQLAMGDRSVCQIEQVLLFFGFDFPGRCERKGEETS